MIYFLVFVILSTVKSERLDFNSQTCQIYKNKLNDESVNGEILHGNHSTKIIFAYNDSQYFNDPQLFGLVEQDGKLSETTCLDLKLLRFDEQGVFQVVQQNFTSGNDTDTKWRQLQYSLENYSNYFASLSYSIYIYYVGNYQYQFVNAQTQEVYKQFNFSICMIYSSDVNFIIDAYMTKLTGEFSTQLTMCQPKAQISFCTDLSCSLYVTDLNFYYNESFIIQILVTDDQLKTKTFQGVGLDYIYYNDHVSGNIISSNLTIPGKAILQLKVDFVSEAVMIDFYGWFTTNQSDPENSITLYSSKINFLPSGTLQWCANKSCSESVQPYRFLGKDIILFQNITRQDLSNSYIFNSTVQFVGINISYGAKGEENEKINNFSRNATIKDVDLSVKGQAKYTITMDFCWSNVALIVKSNIQTQSNLYPIIIQSEAFDLSYTDSLSEISEEQLDETCQTCDQKCKTTGFTDEGCDVCQQSSTQYLVEFKFQIILLILIFY